MKVLAWLKQLVGNKWKEALLIFAFILLLCWIIWRPVHAAEVDLRAGSSFVHGNGPVVGLDVLFPTSLAHGASDGGLQLYAGTLLWGATALTPNNWSWEGGLQACRWQLCARLGAAYLQRIDSLDGSHTNFNLELHYMLPFRRVRSLDFAHLSDAGTTEINRGRNAALVTIRLR